MRINRFLARAGLGSRRGVEDLVRAGRVRVNGEVITDLGRRVDPAEDEILVDGRPVQARVRPVLLLLHKPVGVISSLRRQGDAPCLTDVLPAGASGLFHVGRLDRDSSGLLLLTNDGDLAQHVLHPRHPVWKRYEVRTDWPLADDVLRRWREGSEALDGRPLAPVRVEREDDPTHLVLQLREGRNRQIRRMVEAAGARVVSLHRTAFGPLELGDLGPGRTRPVRPEEEHALREIAERRTDVDDPPAGA